CIKRFNVRLKTFTEFRWSQMNVEPRGHGAFVASKQGNIVKAHSSSFEMRTALMAKGMRRQSRKIDLAADTLHDLIKGSDGQRRAWIACGFRQEDGTLLFTQASPEKHVAISFNVVTNQV